MVSNYIFVTITAIVCFFSCFLVLMPYNGYKYSLHKIPFIKTLTFLPVFILILAVFSFLYFYNPVMYDFIHDISYVDMLIPLLAAGLIYAFSVLPRTNRFLPVVILVASAAATTVLPQNFLLFDGKLPFWADRAAITLIWAAYAYLYRILNGTDGIMPVQTIAFCIGITVLGLLEAVPFFIAVLALALGAIMLAFSFLNWYPAKISFSDGACCSIGFILGWLSLITGSECDIQCSIILNIYYFAEICIALTQIILPNARSRKLTENTLYYKTNISGLSPDIICRHLIKLDSLLIILSIFEIYAPNTYSITIVAAIMSGWFLSQLHSWQTPDKDLKQVSNELLKNIKTGFTPPDREDK